MTQVNPTIETMRATLEQELLIDCIVVALDPFRFRVFFHGEPSERQVAELAAGLFTGFEFFAYDVEAMRESVWGTEKEDIS